MNFGEANLRMDHPTIFEEEEEEDTSIFNMGMPLDATGTEAMFDFGVSNGTSSATGSTFTTHQQQQAEQEMVDKRMSQMQITSTPARSQRTTRDTSDMVCSHGSPFCQDSLLFAACKMCESLHWQLCLVSWPETG